MMTVDAITFTKSWRKHVQLSPFDIVSDVGLLYIAFLVLRHIPSMLNLLGTFIIKQC